MKLEEGGRAGGKGPAGRLIILIDTGYHWRLGAQELGILSRVLRALKDSTVGSKNEGREPSSEVTALAQLCKYGGLD